jgi:hypothetical protein
MLKMTPTCDKMLISTPTNDTYDKMLKSTPLMDD